MAAIWRSAWIGTLIVTLIALCLLPGVSGAARSPIAGVVSQVDKPRPREEFPPSRLEPDRAGNLVTLRYRFQDKDKGGNEKQVSCQIDERRSAELRKGLGLDLCPENRSPYFANQPLSACIRGTGIEWQGQPAVVNSSKGHETHSYAQYMIARGLRCYEGQLVLDYPSLIVRATPVFKNCIQSLNGQLGGETSRNEDLRLLMEFFLAMKSAEVEAVDWKLQKWTGGYLLPTEVMTQNSGDCDSKAAAFCAVKRNSHSLVIFRSSHLLDNSEHGHAFLGFEVPGSSPDLPLRNEAVWTEDDIEAGDYDKVKPLEFWGRSYIPIDATGPRDIHLGEVVAEKAGKYVAIPIPSRDRVPPATDESCLGFSGKVKRHP